MNKSTPRDVFAHLFAVIMLMVSVGSIIALAFQFINVYFPDQIDFYASRRAIGSTIHGAIAALIIAWPVYVYLLWFLGKEEQADPEKREIRVRKWLFTFTLFVAALTIVIDLITLIRNFLGGELSVRFGLKVLAVLVVAGVVFFYYLWDLRREASVKNRVAKPLALVTSLLVIAGIVGGFFLAGSPATQRAWKFDDQRVSDLEQIQVQILNHWIGKQALPTKLEELTDSVSGFIAPVDPETGAGYEYVVTNALQFDLCATFALPSPDIANEATARVLGIDYKWNHGAGRTCFTRTIDPELYKKTGAPVPLDLKR
ncbi:MAG: DUF5671 domain-containing protein [Patescibacteria group bacterium]|jgi:hypothetical protein